MEWQRGGEGVETAMFVVVAIASIVSLISAAISFFMVLIAAAMAAKVCEDVSDIKRECELGKKTMQSILLNLDSITKDLEKLEQE